MYKDKIKRDNRRDSTFYIEVPLHREDAVKIETAIPASIKTE